MAGEIDQQLREEIIECEKTKSEFIRWKLILVAAVGSAGLGVGKEMEPVYPLLGLIPLMCVYVDSVCLHNDARIMMIAHFIRESDQASPEAKAYEEHCQRNREKFYGEGMVLFLCSLFLSLLVGGMGLRQWIGGGALDTFVWSLVSGVVGAIVTFILYFNSTQIQQGKKPFQVLPPQGA